MLKCLGTFDSLLTNASLALKGGLFYIIARNNAYVLDIGCVH